MDVVILVYGVDIQGSSSKDFFPCKIIKFYVSQSITDQRGKWLIEKMIIQWQNLKNMIYTNLKWKKH